MNARFVLWKLQKQCWKIHRRSKCIDRPPVAMDPTWLQTECSDLETYKLPRNELSPAGQHRVQCRTAEGGTIRSTYAVRASSKAKRILGINSIIEFPVTQTGKNAVLDYHGARDWSWDKGRRKCSREVGLLCDSDWGRERWWGLGMLALIWRVNPAGRGKRSDTAGGKREVSPLDGSGGQKRLSEGAVTCRTLVGD